jgi:hypothetical protein
LQLSQLTFYIKEVRQHYFHTTLGINSIFLVVLGEEPRKHDGHAIRPLGVRERDEKETKVV